ncbi:MAG: hypothetical protein Q4C55_03980 [Eubacterium sp.]|nr:hypothetical protein [Eubacterium sp.]
MCRCKKMGTALLWMVIFFGLCLFRAPVLANSLTLRLPTALEGCVVLLKSPEGDEVGRGVLDARGEAVVTPEGGEYAVVEISRQQAQGIGAAGSHSLPLRLKEILVIGGLTSGATALGMGWHFRRKYREAFGLIYDADIDD